MFDKYTLTVISNDMLRFIGKDYSIDLPLQKVLIKVDGIGQGRSCFLLSKLGFNKYNYLRNLNIYYLLLLHTFIHNCFRISTALHREVKQNIKVLIDSNCYRGLRHSMRLPLRGQRTCSNAKTRKKWHR